METTQDKDAPPTIDDHKHLVYKICVLIGLGMILPWNAVLSAFDFFSLKLSNYDPAFSFTFAMNSPNALMQMAVVKWGYRFSLSLRMIASFIGCMVLLVLLPLFTAFMNQDTAYYIDIVVVVLMGFMMAILQASVFGMTGMMPGKYTAASMTGMGLSGAFIGVVRVIILLIWPDVTNSKSNDAMLGAIIYFVISSIVSLLCVAGFIHLIKQPFSEYHLNRDSFDSKFNSSINSISGLDNKKQSSQMILSSPKSISVRRMLRKTGGEEMKFRPQSFVSHSHHITMHITETHEEWVPRSHKEDGSAGLTGLMDDDHTHPPHNGEQHLGDGFLKPKPTLAYRKLSEQSEQSDEGHKAHDVQEEEPAYQKESEDTSGIDPKKPPAFFDLMKSLLGIWFAVMIIYIQTFTCFPGLTLQTSFSFWNDTWYSVTIVLIFNIFDTLGRFSPNLCKLFTSRTIWIPVILRFVFVFTFIYIAAPGTSPHWLFHSDWFIILNMMVFAISNGYLSTLCMIYGPLMVHENARETAGYIMSFGLVSGIFIGAMVGNFGITQINLNSL